jgi:hypothetical protein
VAELADALDSGSSGSKIPWRFEPSQPHTSMESGLWLWPGPVLLIWCPFASWDLYFYLSVDAVCLAVTCFDSLWRP